MRAAGGSDPNRDFREMEHDSLDEIPDGLVLRARLPE
jgi:hypothetical protein